MRELDDQTAGWQHNAQDLQRELRQEKQPGVTDVHGRLQKDTDLSKYLIRFERARIPTEKMHALQCEEAKKKEKRLLSMYEKWKLQVHKARDQLKTNVPESQLWPLIVELKKFREDIMET